MDHQIEPKPEDLRMEALRFFLFQMEGSVVEENN
jgi:hypothetical protein